MGRVKLAIRRGSRTRRAGRSKRRNGLVKKAYELCVLCDIDLALLMLLEPPDPASLASTTDDIDAWEKFLMDVLARVASSKARSNFLLSMSNHHMAPLDPAAPAGTTVQLQGPNEAPAMYVHHPDDDAEGMAAFAGDDATGAQMTPATTCCSVLLHLPTRSSTSGRQGPAGPVRRHLPVSQMLGLHHGDPCVAGLGGNADAEAWRQAYACTELLPTLIPATRAFPLTTPPHCLAPDDEQFLAMQDGRGMVTAHQQQVEASASASASVSCSYVPSDDTGDGQRQRRATGQLRLTA